MTTRSTQQAGVRPCCTDQVKDLQLWRFLALERMPYMASLLFGMRVLNAPGLGTMAVDEHMRLYIDFEALAGYSADEHAQMLLHEVGHVYYRHHLLVEELNVPLEARGTLNVASDASLNDDLRDAGCALFRDDGGFVLPSSIGEPDHRTPHHYYRALRPDDGAAASAVGGEEGSASGQGEGTAGSGRGSQPAPYTGCGSGSGAAPAPCELDDDDADGHAPAAGDGELERALIEVSSAVVEHVRNRGLAPAGMVQNEPSSIWPHHRRRGSASSQALCVPEPHALPARLMSTSPAGLAATTTPASWGPGTAWSSRPPTRRPLAWRWCGTPPGR